MRRALLPIVAAWAFVAVVASADDSRPTSPDVVRVGGRFRVVCHGAGDVVADAALDAAEAAWKEAGDLVGAPPAPAARLEVHVYAKAADYRAVDARIAGGRMKDHFGFADHASKSAHVQLQPECGPEAWARFGVPDMFVRNVAHEAAHLAVYQRAPNYRSHPDWLSEGLATCVEERVLAAKGRTPGPAADPYTSSRMLSCTRLREQGALPEPRAIFRERMGPIDTFDTYAVHWAFMRFLLEPAQLETTSKVLAQAMDLPDGGDFAARLRAVAEAAWGKDGLDALNDGFRKYVDGFAPQWDMSYGELTGLDGSWVQWAGSAKDATYCWRTARVGRSEYRVSGTFEFLPVGPLQMDVDLAHEDGGFLLVVFNATVGVSVHERRSKEATWKQLGFVAEKPAAVGETAFDVAVRGDAVRVSLDQKEVLVVPLHGRDMTGPWGLGVQAGAAGIWRGVELR